MSVSCSIECKIISLNEISRDRTSPGKSLPGRRPRLLPSSLINRRGKLIDIFSKSTEADRQLATVVGLERLLKLAVFSAGHPVRQVTFPAQFAKDTLPAGYGYEWPSRLGAALAVAGLILAAISGLMERRGSIQVLA